MNIAEQDQKLKEVLTPGAVVAVVGLSDKPERASYRVAQFLQEQNYKIIPVNPTLKEVLGEKAYATLQEVPVAIDIVDVFRRSEETPAIAQSAVEVRAKVLWLQEGIYNEQAEAIASAGGLQVVMDRCLLKEVQRLNP